MTTEEVRQRIRQENSRLITELEWDEDIPDDERDRCLLDTYADMYGALVVGAVIFPHPPSEQRKVQMRQRAQWDLSRAGIALMSQFAKEEGSQN